jgi:hypothetical protein
MLIRMMIRKMLMKIMEKKNFKIISMMASSYLKVFSGIM